MPEAPIEFPSLIPPLGDDLLADAALNAVAIQGPQGLDLTVGNPDNQDPQPYGMSWAWDFAARTFKRNGITPVPCWDLDNLKGWVQVALNTTRMSHPIYDDDFGMDEDGQMVGDMMGDPASQEAYMQSVSNALTIHDRITEVTNFDFYVDSRDTGESHQYVDFEIHTDGGDVVPISLVVIS